MSKTKGTIQPHPGIIRRNMKTKHKIEWFLSRTRYNLKKIDFYAQKETGVYKDKEGNKITVIVEVKK